MFAVSCFSCFADIISNIMFVLTLFLISFITNGKNISNIIMETSDR